MACVVINEPMHCLYRRPTDQQACLIQIMPMSVKSRRSHKDEIIAEAGPGLAPGDLALAARPNR
jgi:hypothetical protein